MPTWEDACAWLAAACDLLSRLNFVLIDCSDEARPHAEPPRRQPWFDRLDLLSRSGDAAGGTTRRAAHFLETLATAGRGLSEGDRPQSPPPAPASAPELASDGKDYCYEAGAAR